MSVYFDAIQRRFQGDKQTVKSCRKIYEGMDGERFKTLPHVVMIVRDRVPMDSFTSDIEDAKIEFQLWSKDFRTKGGDEMISNMIRLFDDAVIEDSDLTIYGFRRTGIVGPLLDDDRYRASITYQAFTTFHNRSPVVRAG